MSCSKDKKKAFLTKTKTRIRNRVDEQEERAKASTNSFLGQTIFTARIVSLPTEFQSVTVTVGGTDTTYQGIVKVRIEKLDRMLANPLSKGMTDGSFKTMPRSRT